MAKAFEQLKGMIETVARALGDEMLNDVAFVGGCTAFQEQLKSKGFGVSLDDDVICRMRLGELKVDFMPDNEAILGFSNRWYRQALETAQAYQLTDDIVIRLLTPPYFVATKLEAYKGRGNDDPLASHDMEDILNIVDGRPELIDEIKAAQEDVRLYIAEQIDELLAHEMIDYAIQGIVMGNADRAAIVFARLEAIQALKGIN